MSGRPPRRRADASRALPLLFAAALAAGCAGGAAPRTPEAPPPGSSPAALPWQLAPDAYPSQRLFRLDFESADGDGALRLVLRLVDPDRYRLTIADRLGRSLYTVDADPGGGFLLDHREQLVCPLSPDVRLEELPIDPLPLSSLPAVLLGRLPTAPGGGGGAVSEAGELSYRDAAGRRWTAGVRGGAPERWTLWLGGEPAVWWRRLDGEAMLSDRRRGVRMIWREVGREPLAGALGPPAAPDDYRSGLCGGHPPDSAGFDGGSRFDRWRSAL